MRKEFTTKKVLIENQLKKEAAIFESFAKTFNKIKRLDEQTLNEELYDFISDFKRTEGRPPTKDEIDALYYGKGKEKGSSVSYIQSGEDGIYVGDTIINKKTGQRYIVTKEPYHKISWNDEEGRDVGYSAINVKDESGKTFSMKAPDKYSDYEKVHSDTELKSKADKKAKDDVYIDMISQKLIDGGFIDAELKSGVMFDSFTKNATGSGVMKHNEEIRNAIKKIGQENEEIPYSIIDKYWHKFW